MLLLAVAMEFDTRIAGVCARAHRVPAMDYPTFALAMSVFDDPAWDAISPERHGSSCRILGLTPGPVGR